MFNEPTYRSLTAYELVEGYEAYLAGEKWEDPRATPVTVEQWIAKNSTSCCI